MMRDMETSNELFLDLVKKGSTNILKSLHGFVIGLTHIKLRCSGFLTASYKNLTYCVPVNFHGPHHFKLTTISS
ncbi:unnamed protein product [Schistosoma rodhaini]|uniref:Uncharacterized protein n=1 Tax=Schistosoma rodhaini TaxID=6188 RepID=A0AA85FYK9_9TREM|nr:unnamed protein product [Schistosoma rodhaini]